MTERNLRVVSSDAAAYELGVKPESVADRARRLHQEAQILACEEVDILRHTLAEALTKACAIRDGGEIFPIGVREQARQLSDVLPLAMQNLQALSERHVRDITRSLPPPVWKT